MLTVTIGNGKGGAGKTTTAANLAAVLSRHLRVLLVDMDPQSQLSSHFAVTVDPQDTIGALILSPGRDLSEIAVPLDYNLDLVPASRVPLELAETQLDRQGPGGEAVLASMLAPLGSTYDVAVIDTPPRLTVLTTSALVASDAVVAVLPAETFPLEGAAALMQHVSEVVASGRNPRLQVAGVLLTMVHPEAEEYSQVKAAIEALGWPLLDAEIPDSRLASKAIARGAAAVQAFPSYPVSLAYAAAATELIDRLGTL